MAFVHLRPYSTDIHAFELYCRNSPVYPCLLIMPFVSAMVLLRRILAVDVWDCSLTIDVLQANKVVEGLLLLLHVI